MNSLFESRGSDSPYIEAVWHGQAGSDYTPVCPASGHWHLLFLRQNGMVKVSILSPAAKTSFGLAGSRWQCPDYENVETFVEKLVRESLLVSDPIVKAVLQNHPQEVSLRTVRRRFLFATGLTYKVISQIERAKQAAALLEQGVSLIEAAYQSGYADQSHMTRSLKHFIGHTPAQIALIRKP